jgi:hypothetical protein
VAFLLDVQPWRIQMIECIAVPTEAFVIQCLRHATGETFAAQGETGLADRSCTPHRSPGATPRDVVSKILYLRQHYQFGPGKIADYLKRFHQLAIAVSSVHRILVRHGMNRLPANPKHRPHKQRWQRYEKPQPGHRLQMDVKFLERIPGTRKRLYQFTAIDDCTRIRVLKVYDVCNQATAIRFVDEVLRRLPFRVQVVQTDNGAEFQWHFHWHLERLDIRHVYIRPRTPRASDAVAVAICHLHSRPAVDGRPSPRNRNRCARSLDRCRRFSRQRRLDLLFLDVEIGPHVLHVIVVVDRFGAFFKGAERARQLGKVGPRNRGPRARVAGRGSRGARAALAFSRAVGRAQPALIDGRGGLVLAPRGRLSRAVTFTVRDSRIVGLTIVADPDRLRDIEIAVL